MTFLDDILTKIEIIKPRVILGTQQPSVLTDLFTLRDKLILDQQSLEQAQEMPVILEFDLPSEILLEDIIPVMDELEIIPEKKDNTLRNALLIGGALLLL